eukprot:gene3042-5052_t
MSFIGRRVSFFENKTSLLSKEEPRDIVQLASNAKNYSLRITFQQFFETPIGKSVFIKNCPSLMKVYFENVAFLDLLKLEKVEEKVSENEKQRIKEVLNSEVKKHSSFKKIIERNGDEYMKYHDLKLKLDVETMLPFLMRYHGFEAFNYIHREGDPLNKAFGYSAENPMKVVKEILYFLMDTLQNDKFWKEEKVENENKKLFNKTALFADKKNKQWEYFKEKTSQISALNLQLLPKGSFIPFFINFYNLLFLDIYLTNNLDQTRSLNYNVKPLTSFYQVGNKKWYLKDILSKLSENEEFLFCLIDCTNSSPKFKIYENEIDVQEQCKTYLQQKVNIIHNQIQCPHLFDVHFESFGSNTIELTQWIAKRLQYPFQVFDVLIEEVHLSLKNILNIPERDVFYFDNLRSGVEVTSEYQYFWVKDKSGIRSGIVHFSDGSYFKGDFLNEKKIPRGTIKVDNLILEGEYNVDAKKNYSGVRIDHNPFEARIDISKLFTPGMIDYAFMFSSDLLEKVNDLQQGLKMKKEFDEDHRIIVKKMIQSMFIENQIFEIFKKYLIWMIDQKEKHKIKNFKIELMKDVESFIDFGMNHFYSIINVQKNDDNWSVTNTEEKQSLVNEEIYDAILSQLYSILMPLINEEFQNEEVLVTNKISILKEITPQELNLELSNIPLEHFDGIIKKLNTFEKDKLILRLSEKKYHLTMILQSIEEIKKDFTQQILVYCLVKSDVENIVSECDYFRSTIPEIFEIEKAIQFIKDSDFFFRNDNNEIISKRYITQEFTKNLTPYLNYTKELRNLKEILISMSKSTEVSDLHQSEIEMCNKILKCIDSKITKIKGGVEISAKTKYPSEFYLSLAFKIESELSIRNLEKQVKSFKGKQLKNRNVSSKNLERHAKTMSFKTGSVIANKAFHAMTTIGDSPTVFSPRKFLNKSMDSINDMKKIDIFDDKILVDLFILFLKEKNLYAHVKYYEKYQEYINEKSISERAIVIPAFFKRLFFSKEGKYHISSLSKFTPKYDEKSIENGFNIIYDKLLSQFESKEFESYKNHFTKAPFDKVTEDKFVFKLFSNFVIDCKGHHYIACWNNFQKYQTNPKEVVNDLISFCENHLHNETKRNEIITFNKKKEKTIGNYEVLFDYVKKILRDEYFPRFLNSKYLKLYSVVKPQEVKDLMYILFKIQKNQKLSNFIDQLDDRILEDHFEIIHKNESTGLVELKSKLTNELFSGKRFTSKYFHVLQNVAIKYLNMNSNHRNLIHLIDLIVQKSKKNGYFEMFIVTSKIDPKRSLKDLIDVASKEVSENPLSLCKKIFLGIFNLNLRSIKCENICSSNIYILENQSVVIDPGFYFDHQTTSSGHQLQNIGSIFAQIRFLRVLDDVSTSKFIEAIQQIEIHGDILIQMINSLISPSEETTLNSFFKDYFADKNEREFLSKSEILEDIKANYFINEFYRDFFREHSRIDDCIEIILCLEDIELFTASKTHQEKFDKAEEISEYFTSKSDLEVNISGQGNRDFLTKYDEMISKGEFSDKLFKKVRGELKATMADPFLRFSSDNNVSVVHQELLLILTKNINNNE